jgi:hypothetical protein
MSISAYWFGNFIFDYLLYLILAVFSIVMCLVLEADPFIGNALSVIVVVFLAYGLAYIPMTYIFAYVFKDYGNAQAGYYFFTFVVGGLLPIVILALRFVGGLASTVGMYIGWVLKCVPCFCFG